MRCEPLRNRSYGISEPEVVCRRVIILRTSKTVAVVRGSRYRSPFLLQPYMPQFRRRKVHRRG
jgi:hypothetical protein